MMYWMNEESLLCDLRARKRTRISDHMHQDAMSIILHSMSSEDYLDLRQNLYHHMQHRWNLECFPIVKKTLETFDQELQKLGLPSLQMEYHDENHKHVTVYHALSENDIPTNVLFTNYNELLEFTMRYQYEQIHLRDYKRQKSILQENFSSKSKLNNVYKAYWNTRNQLKTEFEQYWRMNYLMFL